MATKSTKTVKKTTKKPIKKAVARPKTKASHAKKTEVKSFKRHSDREEFFALRVTDQTIYWAILSIAVLLLGAWVVNINDRVQHIYDDIDQTYKQQNLAEGQAAAE